MMAPTVQHVAAPVTTFAAPPAVHHVVADPITTPVATAPAVHHVVADPITTPLAPAHSMVAAPAYDFSAAYAAPAHHLLPSTPSMIAYPHTPFQFTAGTTPAPAAPTTTGPTTAPTTAAAPAKRDVVAKKKSSKKKKKGCC